MRLPSGFGPLSDRAAAIHRALCLVLILLSLVGLPLGTWRSQQQLVYSVLAFYGSGVRLDAVDGRMVLTEIGDPRANAVVSKSELLAIDGAPLPPYVSTVDRTRISDRMTKPDGQSVRLTVRNPDGRVTDHRFVRSPAYLAQADRTAPMTFANRMRLSLVSSLLPGILFFVAGILLLRGRRRDPVVALLSIGLLADPASRAVALLPLALIDPVGDVVNTVSTIVLMTGILVFPSGRFEPRWASLALPIFAIPFVANIVVKNESLATAIGLLSAVFMLAIIVHRYRRLPAGLERQQIKWALLGFAIFFGMVIATSPLPMLIRSSVAINNIFLYLIINSILQALALTCFLAGLIVSLLRFRLYDADAAISRSAVIAGLTVSLIAIFAATEKLIEIIGEHYFEGSIGPAAGAIGAGFAAMLIAPLHHRLSHWAEKRFQRGLVKLREGLPLLVGDLRETASSEELGHAALDRIATALRSSHAALVVGDERRLVGHRDIAPATAQAWLAGWIPAARTNAIDCDRDEPLFPLRAPLLADGVGLVGWLLLGPRPDGSFYGKDELGVLAEIDESLARALAITQRREARDLAEAIGRASVATRLAELERAFATLGAGPLTT